MPLDNPWHPISKTIPKISWSHLLSTLWILKRVLIKKLKKSNILTRVSWHWTTNATKTGSLCWKKVTGRIFTRVLSQNNLKRSKQGKTREYTINQNNTRTRTTFQDKNNRARSSKSLIEYKRTKLTSVSQPTSFLIFWKMTNEKKLPDIFL